MDLQGQSSMIGGNFANSILVNVQIKGGCSSAVAGNIGAVMGQYGSRMIGCSISGCGNYGVDFRDTGSEMLYCIVTNNYAAGIYVNDPGGSRYPSTIAYCTVDSGQDDGIKVDTAATLAMVSIFSCDITNNNVAAKYGLNIAAGTAAANDLIKTLVDFNNFYGNTTDRHNISAGANDIAVNPSFPSGTNFTPQTGAKTDTMYGKGFPGAFLGLSNPSYTYPGAVQPARLAAGGGGGGNANFNRLGGIKPNYIS